MSTDNTARTDAFESSIRDLVGLGRMWAAHGLEIGSKALEASAESLSVTSRFLAELKAQVTEADAKRDGAPPAVEG